MDQDQRIDCSVSNQFGSHHGLAKRGWCTQDAFIMPERLAYGLGLIITEISMKVYADGLAGVTFVANHHADSVFLQ